jgi:hypothetical protein
MQQTASQTQTEAAALQPRTALEGIWKAGLTDREILRLIWPKGDVLAGRRNGLTLAYKRLVFARYRIERGLLHD